MPAAAKFSNRDLNSVLNYIENFWPKLLRKNPNDHGTLIGLPNSYIVPAAGEWFGEQYYWDTYPVVLAFCKDKKYQDLARGMIDNLLFLFGRFGIVPNASRFYFLSRSQPPFLSSMVWAVFEATSDFGWFKRAISLVEKEYLNIWTCKVHPNARNVYGGLSRYYDVNVLSELAEIESGWDNTCRFDGRCLDFLPIDLNCLLYKYEKDLASAYGLLGDFKKEETYHLKAKKRADTICKLMWDESQGYFFDFDFALEKRSSFASIAGIFPLFVRLASKEQAEKVVSFCEKNFEKRYGIVQSQKIENGKQWDFPNGWPMMQFISVMGLLNYGYVDLAERIIKKWLAGNIKVFKETGMLWEKYDVVLGKIGKADRYSTQPGFAWTNACFLLLISILNDLKKEVTPRLKTNFLQAS